jgi:hypothetical protein
MTARPDCALDIIGSRLHCIPETLMFRRIPSSLLIFLCLSAFAIGQAAPAVQVVTADGHSTSLNSVQIASMPHITVSATDHGTAAEFSGVPLSALLTSSGVSLGDSLRGPRLAEALLVTGADGYKVVFALAELDSAFTSREIILADKRDGKPLNEREGPFRIVAPGDKRPARWVRQVVELRIVSVK